MTNNEYPYNTDIITDHTRRPYYNDESDYNTNSPSYYDDLSRKQRLIQYLAEKVGNYDIEMEKRFNEWDELISKFPENVENLLIQWMEDGTLDKIINENIFNMKADKINVDEIFINIKTRALEEGIDITSEMNTLIAENKGQTLWFPFTVDAYILNSMKIQHPIRIMGNNSLITTNIPDKRVIEVSHPTELVPDVTVENMAIHQFGNHTSNNDSAIKFKGTVNAKALTNSMRGVDVGVSTAYGEVTALDRLARYNLVAFNFMHDIKRMGIENIGSAYNVMIGNRMNGNGALSHGIRSTGYGINDGEIGTESKGHTGVANIIHGMQTGFSLQNTAKLNTFTGNNIEKLTHSVVHMLKGTAKDNNPLLNTFSNNTFNDVEHVIYNQGGNLNKFDFIGQNVRNEFILEETNTESIGFNEYKIKAKDIIKGGTLRYPDNHIDLDLYNVTGRALTISSSAKRTTGRIKVNGCDNAIGIFSDDNNLQVTVTNAHQVNAKSITVYGNNNVIEVFTDGDVTITGQNNVIKGVVKGVVEVLSTSGTNDFSQVAGYKKTGTLFNSVTDATGNITITNPLKTGLISVLSNEYGLKGYTINASNVSKETITFNVKNRLGENVTNENVNISYTVTARNL